MKIYDQVKSILVNHPETRSSDKELIWRLIEMTGSVRYGSVSKEGFMRAPAFESITRARRKVQEHYPELAATPEVKAGRKVKEETKGTFVYREESKDAMPGQLGFEM